MRLEWIGLGAERSFESQVCVRASYYATRTSLTNFSSPPTRSGLICFARNLSERNGVERSSHLS